MGRHAGALSAVGEVLRHWRRARGKSQLDLALDAATTPRHVSFIETGRAKPSREMIHTLAGALEIPLRDRNTLLVAAGFAPLYGHRDLAGIELAPARRALDLLLQRHEPYPAVVMDRRWNLVQVNRGGERFFGALGADLDPGATVNVLRAIFHPDGLRPSVEDWETVAESLVQRVHRESIGGVPDAEVRAILDEVLRYPGVPPRWRTPNLGAPLDPLVPVTFRNERGRWRFFSTVTTLGTPQDVTLQELRVECFFPADQETERRIAADPTYDREPAVAVTGSGALQA